MPFTTIQIRNENLSLVYKSTPDSTFKKLTTIPVYILTSYKTFSAAECLAYAMQSNKRAVIVGETTRGGAHIVTYRPLGAGFVSDIPFGKATDAVTGKNWEKTGVVPDIKINSDSALEQCEIKILESRLAIATDSLERKKIHFYYRIRQSMLHPFTTDTTEFRRQYGRYGAYDFTNEGTKVYYQKAGKARFEMHPIDANTWRPKGNDTFIIEFRDNENMIYNRMITHYDDGRVEIAHRN